MHIAWLCIPSLPPAVLGSLAARQLFSGNAPPPPLPQTNVAAVAEQPILQSSVTSDKEADPRQAATAAQNSCAAGQDGKGESRRNAQKTMGGDHESCHVSL